MTDAPAHRPVVLVIIDGFGWRDATADNAIRLARMPRYDTLWEHGPRGFLRACGAEVGLGEGQVGSSEVGHRNIGAGRLVWRDAPPSADGLLGDVIARAGRTQIRIATAEKMTQMTRFINGGVDAPYPGEDRLVCPDPATEAARVIADGRHDFVLINLPDADLGGHTGDLARAIEGVERVDAALGVITDSTLAAGGAMLVTSDHGNCETMRDAATGGPHRGHTANDVPVILMAHGHYLFRDGRLADVAPTLLKLMGLAAPDSMTGRPLLRGNMEGLDRARMFDERSPLGLITYVA